MDLGISGKIGIVTGASAGIGRGIAAELAREGVHVIMVARGADALRAAEKEIAATGSVESHVVDVSDVVAYESFLHDTIGRHGRIDLIVNNAGGGSFAPLEQMTHEQWQDAFRLNVDAAFASLRVALPQMRSTGGGAIVNITSVMGARSQALAGAYGSAKAALQHLTNIAAVEGAPGNVRVNTIQVGSIVTEGTQAYCEAYPEMAAKVVGAIPMHRWGHPSDIANAVCFLASDRAGFITGACLPIDGGLSIAFPY